jgi:hypothetical protein
MSKKREAIVAQSFSIRNCECCGGVNIELWHGGKIVAVACPSSADIADRAGMDLLKAAHVMREAEGKPHVH